ncbi:MAG: hypothetical protein H0W72_05195 [Planctomycetes bacterium]|nr:hypothetical protein [Planctomycetota bacterium]
MTASKYPCPACGFTTFCEEGAGSYDICTVFGWEDDGVQYRYPDLTGGANRESLLEAQTAALLNWPLIERTFAGQIRDLAWKPLVPADLETSETDFGWSVPTKRHRQDDGATYYWRGRC